MARGACPFTEKVLRLVHCGVVGVVFVNSKDELTVPADPDEACAAVGNLPVLLVKSSIGALLRDGVALSQAPEAAEVS